MDFIPIEKVKKDLMKDPEFRKIYEEMRPGFEFAEMIISKRLEKDMTQEDLAEKLSVGKSEVYKIESGEYNPSLKFLYKIAKVFDSEVEIKLR